MTRNALNLILAVFMSAAAATLFATASTAESPPRLLVVVTSQEPEVQGMAMVLSKQSHGRGAEVRILLCGPGGDLALKDAAQVKLKPRGMTPQRMLSGLLEAGVRAEVCALYLPNRDKQPGDLLAGVGVAKPPAIAEAMLAPDTRLFTF